MKSKLRQLNEMNSRDLCRFLSCHMALTFPSFLTVIAILFFTIFQPLQPIKPLNFFRLGYQLTVNIHNDKKTSLVQNLALILIVQIFIVIIMDRK